MLLFFWAMVMAHSDTQSLTRVNTSGTLGQSPWNVVVGDINQDGHLDLAVASDNAGSVSILQGNGNGTFKAVIYIATPARNR